MLCFSLFFRFGNSLSSQPPWILGFGGEKVILTGFPNHSKKGIRLLMQLIQPLLMLLSHSSD